MMQYLEFEKDLADIDKELADLEVDSIGNSAKISAKMDELKKSMEKTYSNLTPWQKVLIARHADRPKAKQYINTIFDDFFPLSGDRFFGEDEAIICGLASFCGDTVMVMGTEKGGNTDERLRCGFGMAKPEGYRKAIRLINMAEHFGIPIITFVDTPGAYPGVEAEQRGQHEAIAQCISAMLGASVPMISVVIGEGGSGGAVALASGHRVLMLEHAVYSVISPEGCASILWRSKDHKEMAADALKLTAQDLHGFGLIHDIIAEPLGAAHRNPGEVILSVKEAIHGNLSDLLSKTPAAINKDRDDFLYRIGIQN